MTTPHYNKKYQTGLIAPHIDWVAGGNFDGYVIQKSLIFFEEGQIVELSIEIIDQSRYDGNKEAAVIQGTFEFTDKDTLTLHFSSENYRGKILGPHQNLLAFAITSEKSVRNEVYELNQKQ